VGTQKWFLRNAKSKIKKAQGNYSLHKRLTELITRYNKNQIQNIYNSFISVVMNHKFGEALHVPGMEPNLLSIYVSLTPTKRWSFG
jgi:hypothetical protein